MAVLKNRAKMSTSTTGTGTITLGSAESGYQTFADAGVANSDIVRYVIEDDAAWEIGTGTYTSSGTTLTRTVSESSNSDAALNLSGAAVVFVGATAEDILQPSGGTMTGNLALGDSVKATFGTGGDLEIYHDGSNSYISDTSGTGDLWLRGANLRLTDPDGTLFLFGANNANTRLYFAGVQKLTTTSTGTTINGTLNILPSNTIGSYTLPATDGTSGQVLTTNGSGAITFADTAADATKLPLAGGAMTGAITTNSTFDGRDVSADGTKLDFITVTQAVDLDQMETDIAALANGMVYKGNWDASSGSFPGGGSAQTGWFYYVSVAGTVGGVSFAIGDNIVATTDNASASTFAGNWSKHDQTDAVQAVVGLTGSITKSGLLSALNVEDGADVTNTSSVTAAGALMDSEVDADIKTFVLPANTTISTFGASLVDDLTASAAQTTLGLGSFTRKFRETSGTAGSTSGDWMTVASNQSSRRRGEVLVSDADSGDHAFIRIDWLRSYADTTFTVLSCGGHQNRITGVRVLQETADPTYGWKYLQVYVVASSFYRVQTFIPADTSGWTGHTAVTPVVQNTLTGYSVQGAALSGLDTYPLASQQGILAGDDIQTYGDIIVGGTVDGVDIAARDAVLTSTTTTANAALPKAGGTMTGDLSFGDNDVALFGAGNDLQIYHSGTHSFIADAGTGNLVIRGTNLSLANASWSKNYLTAADGGSLNLFYDNASKLSTTSTGIDVTGGGTLTSDLIINSVGANNNAAGTDNIKVSGYGIVGNRGTFYITNDGTVQIGVGGTHNTNSAMTFGTGSNISQKTLYENTNRVFNDAYHPNADILTTARTINGVSFNGSANITVADATKLPLAGGTMTGNLSFGDNDKAIFGAGSDLQVYHDGSNSYIKDIGTGNLVIEASNNHFIKFINGDYAIITTENGGVSLSYDNFIRFATTSTGINVNGTITATVQSSATTTPVPVATFQAAYSSTGTSDGFGPRVILKGEGADGSAQDFAYIDSVISYWGTGTDLVFYTRPNNGTPTETLRFKYGKSAHFQDSIEIGSDKAIYSSGTMRVASNTKVEITNVTGSGSKIMADFTVDGAARLYDNEIIRLATTSTGIDVTGTVTATSFSGGGIPTLFVESSGTATAPNSSDSVAIGGYAVSSGTNSTALGRANAGGTDSFAAAIGDVTTTYGAQGTGSISIGTLSKATQIAGTAVGYGATSTHQASSAFGTSATTTANNQIALGGSGVTARISGAYTLPAADGTANQVLTTDGSGAVTFATAAGGSSGLPIALSIVFGR